MNNKQYQNIDVKVSYATVTSILLLISNNWILGNLFSQKYINLYYISIFIVFAFYLLNQFIINFEGNKNRNKTGGILLTILIISSFQIGTLFYIFVKSNYSNFYEGYNFIYVFAIFLFVTIVISGFIKLIVKAKYYTIDFSNNSMKTSLSFLEKFGIVLPIYTIIYMILANEDVLSLIGINEELNYLGLIVPIVIFQLFFAFISLKTMKNLKESFFSFGLSQSLNVIYNMMFIVLLCFSIFGFSINIIFGLFGVIQLIFIHTLTTNIIVNSKITSESEKWNYCRIIN